MSFFKCKMCGGTIEFDTGATIGVCDSCGTKQTLPKLDVIVGPIYMIAPIIFAVIMSLIRLPVYIIKY